PGTDSELLLRELGGWDWELCRRELPAVLPRLLISFLRACGSWSTFSNCLCSL
uniref:Uncharacterized protein n=1 Tax=Pavo cristatus TaxID=9049 RepID=A0A8C9G0D9_PAVCR